MDMGIVVMDKLNNMVAVASTTAKDNEVIVSITARENAIISVMSPEDARRVAIALVRSADIAEGSA